MGIAGELRDALNGRAGDQPFREKCHQVLMSLPGRSGHGPVHGSDGWEYDFDTG